MTTIAKEKTYAFQESELLNNGFKPEVLDARMSRFKSDSQYAFVIWLNNGQGFTAEFYDIATKA